MSLVLLLLAGVIAWSPFGNTSGQSAASHKDIPTITRNAQKSVVLILATEPGGKLSQGSGFVISRDGKVVTNFHVIANAASAIVKFHDGAFYDVAGLVAFDIDRDIAILRARGSNFVPLRLGDSNSSRIGEKIVAIGSPLLLEATISNGIISGIRELDSLYNTVIQITAPISQGSSGGPLFNIEGEVIGITSFQVTRGQNLNFAIPINTVKEILRDESNGLYYLPEETRLTPTRKSAPPPAESEPPTTTSAPIRTWKNLRDGGMYTTRIIEGSLYLERVSGGQGNLTNCEFRRAITPSLDWIGKCWHIDPNTGKSASITAFISLFSPTKIEGDQFTLIPAE